jgi:hypothetical protein
MTTQNVDGSRCDALTTWARLETTMRKRFGILMGLALVTLVAETAGASTITIAGCPSCSGLSYSLTVTPNTGTQYFGELSISGVFTGSSAYRFVAAVDFKVSDSVMAPLTLTSAPGGTSAWSTSQNGINNSGCGTNGTGFVCSQDPVPVSAASLGYDGSAFTAINLTWDWTFDIPA